MSISSKFLMSVATVLADKDVRSLIGKLEVDDILEPIGLTRRRTHLGESLLFMGVGVVMGGAAAFALASTRKKEVISWLSEKVKASVDVVEKGAASANDEAVSLDQTDDKNHHQPGPVDAVV